MDERTSELLWIIGRLLVLEVERNPEKTKKEIIEKWELASPAPKRIRELLSALK